MGKKIVVITGSSRKGATKKMTDAFIEAAEAKGHTVTRLDATKLNIGFCRGCYSCFKTGKPCTFEDDFDTVVAPAVLEADDIVFAMPVFWFSVPASVKLVLDKFCAFETGKTDFSGKAFGLIASCAGVPMVFESLRMTIERSANQLGSHVFGEVCIPSLVAPNDIDKTDGCAQAAALADKL